MDPYSKSAILPESNIDADHSGSDPQSSRNVPHPQYTQGASIRPPPNPAGPMPFPPDSPNENALLPLDDDIPIYQVGENVGRGPIPQIPSPTPPQIGVTRSPGSGQGYG